MTDRTITLPPPNYGWKKKMDRTSTNASQREDIKTFISSEIRKCPSCELKSDAASTFCDATDGPQDGNFNICSSCGYMSVFCDNTTKLRKPTEEELLDLKSNKEGWEEVKKAQKLVLKMKGW